MSKQIVAFAALSALVLSGCAAAPDGPSTPSTSSSVPSTLSSTAPGQRASASTNEAPAASPSDSPSVASPESTPRQLDPATYTPPAAAFEMLGAGEAKPGHYGDHLDFSGATTEELALYEALNTAIVPTNSCHLYELPADPTPAVAAVQDFVDCLPRCGGPGWRNTIRASGPHRWPSAGRATTATTVAGCRPGSPRTASSSSKGT